MTRPIPAIVETEHAAVEAAVRAYFSALREAEAQLAKAEKRYDDAKKAVELRRKELGLALLKARQAWPERGPKAKGWGEFLEREGLTQSTAWRLMEEAGGKVSCAPHETPDVPHAADRESDPADRPAPTGRKALGLLADMQLLVGRWEDVLSKAEIGMVDAVITDPPFSKRTHDSKPTRNDGVDPSGLTPSYPPWEKVDVEKFVDAWAPRCRGWLICLCDDEMIPWYRAAYERHNRFAFAPVPCVIWGMTVRTRGDGPSSEAVYAMVSRPRTQEFVAWGTTRGAHVGNKEPGSKEGRGKPRWLTDALVAEYSRPSDLVCDPLAGYGGTLVSALLQRRRAIGAEMDEAAVTEAFVRANALNEEQPAA